MNQALFVAALISLASLAACAAPPLPAMSPASSIPPAPDGQALVVFVRPASSCDTSDHAVVADERGGFLGNLAPQTKFAIAVPPGEHTFFAWPSLDLRLRKYPGYDPVGAVRVSVSPGEVRHLPVVVPAFEKLHCYRNAVFSLGAPVAPDDLRAWAQEAQPMRPDRVIGQQLLDEDPPLVQAHLRAGRRRLQPPPQE